MGEELLFYIGCSGKASLKMTFAGGKGANQMAMWGKIMV